MRSSASGSNGPFELLIVRHGPAEDRDPRRWPDDEDRPLTRPGVQQTRDAARGLRRLVPRLGRLITSPAVRARKTAKCVQEAYDGEDPTVWDELRPDAAASPILARLADDRRRTPDPTAVVGHEPALGELVGLSLYGEAVSVVRLSKAGAAFIEFPRAIAPGAGRLVWMLPRQGLRRLDR